MPDRVSVAVVELLLQRLQGQWLLMWYEWSLLMWYE